MDPLEGQLIRLPLRQGAVSADAVFEDMLTGWKRQQLARNFTVGTIRGRESLVRRFVDHTGHFPWDWTVGDADDFFAHERSIVSLAFATIRAYQTHLKVFCDFLTDPMYEWDRICIQAFGHSPAQIITEFNRARHAQNNGQAPAKRPFTRTNCRDSLIWGTLRSNGCWPQGARAPSPPIATPPCSKLPTPGGSAPTRSRTCRPWIFREPKGPAVR